MDESSELAAAPRRDADPVALDGAPSLDSAKSGPKLSRHHRRNSTVQEQRAIRAKAAENELMLSMPRETTTPINPETTTSRYIPWNVPDVPAAKFDTNAVSTAKYDRLFITFIPIFLFEMFSRVAYLYFLFQAGLSWWPNVSPFKGYGATMALIFVLAAAAIKSIIEDRKRHQEDRKTNNSTAVVFRHDEGTGKWREERLKWSEVTVGDIVKVSDGELFPADLMCLHCALDEHICYVKTTNLDGETNLKVKRQALDEEFYKPGWSEDDILNMRMEVECEKPNSNLHSFRGRVGMRGEDSKERMVPIAMSQMLLRGCLLRNSHYVLGVVVYTGAETRIQMNSAAAPLKVGSFDHFLNMQVAILIIGQTLLCILCAVLKYSWRETKGRDRYYLELNTYDRGNEENGFVYTILSFITFWILYSYLVPISLFVTLEIVKFWQGFVFINMDPEMRDESGEGAKCRNSNLNEDLGKIDYIFSDKTGTLTSNEMRLRLVAIKGAPLGDLNKNLEGRPDLQGLAAFRYFSKPMHDALQAIKNDEKAWDALIKHAGSPREILGMKDSASGPRDQSFGDGAGHFLPYHTFDFWINLALCHALLVDTTEGAAAYQGPSPDEVALVECARTMGFEYVSRSATETTLNILGRTATYETLYVNEFSSERQRMSVIVRCPDGTIKIFCKGADAMMLQRLSSDTDADLLSRVNDNLHYFSTKGLRTLVIGTREIDPDTFERWADRFEAAQGNLMGGTEIADKCMDEIESNLEMVGVTAIEDKLQDDVPKSIATMLDAGVKVWMITGDKQETAINIAVSCKLFTNSDSVLKCNGNRATAMQRVEALTHEAETRMAAGEATELVVDGKTLTYILSGEKPSGKGNSKSVKGGDAADAAQTREAEAKLAHLGSLCSAVVVCRASPSQKANIVSMMRQYELDLAQRDRKGPLGRWLAKLNRNLGGKMLAIGDGANDVAMIQAADVGIGIAGKEGRQAVNNSDYAIPQFRFITRLLLVHGQLSRYRLGRLIKYSFYKNSTFAGVLFYFQIYNGFSGQTLVDDISAAVYNVIFTSLPILFFSLLDRPCQFSTLLNYPRTYNKSLGLSIPIFWKTGVLHAFLDAAICFFIPFLAASPTGERSVIDVFSIGKTISIAMLGVVTMELMIVTRYWTWWFLFICLLSYALVYPFVLVFPLLQQAFGTWDMAHYGIGVNIMRTPYFWISLLTVYAMTFSIRYFERSAKWLFRPDDNMIRAELEVLNRTHPGSFDMSASPLSDSLPPPSPHRPLADDPRHAPAGSNIEPQASRGSVRSRVSHNGADLHGAGGFGASPHGDPMSGLSSPEARP